MDRTYLKTKNHADGWLVPFSKYIFMKKLTSVHHIDKSRL